MKHQYLYWLVPFALLVFLVGLMGWMIYSSNVKEREDALHIVLESSEARWFELTAFDEPKNAYADLKDVVTGETHDGVYVSKHCNTWRQHVVIGKAYQVTIETYFDDRTNARTVKFKGLPEAFCAP